MESYAAPTPGKLPNKPGISDVQRQPSQKETPKGDFEGEAGNGIESRGKSVGKSGRRREAERI